MESDAGARLALPRGGTHIVLDTDWSRRWLGLVTAVGCSTAFQKLGETQAKIFGVPDLPLLVIHHPLRGLDIDRVRGRAEVATPQLVRLIREHAR